MSTPEILLAEFGLTPADVYDLFFSRAQELPALLSFFGWFFERLPPHASILDIGCGTGRLLRPLQGLGCKISGVEPRASYRERAAHSAPVYDGDFHHLPALQVWELLFAINGPLLYLTRWQERQEALIHCFSALTHGGWLLLEVPNFLYLLKNYQAPLWQTATYKQYELRRYATHRFEYGAALWLHEERVEWRAARSDSYIGYTEQYTFAMTTPQELEMMLQRAGFITVEFYRDWSARSPGSRGEQRILVAAQKGK
jgi:SAM-dependent methyltransferase